MRTFGVGLGCWMTLLFLLAGCKSTPDLKPPSKAEILAGPPADDRRYDFPNYPKEALTVNTSADPKRMTMPGSGNNGNGPMMPGSFGGQGGMGGGGMGGMGR